MTPTLLPGDWLLVRHGAPIRPGSLVLARFRRHHHLMVLKRAVAEQDGGWLLASDNPAHGIDSRQYGVADVEARVVRIWTRRTAAAHGAGITGAAAAIGGRWRRLRRRWWGQRPIEFFFGL